MQQVLPVHTVLLFANFPCFEKPSPYKSLYLLFDDCYLWYFYRIPPMPVLVAPHEDVIQMLPNVFCQKRHYDVRLPGHLVKADKFRISPPLSGGTCRSRLQSIFQRWIPGNRPGSICHAPARRSGIPYRLSVGVLPYGMRSGRNRLRTVNRSRRNRHRCTVCGTSHRFSV